MFALLAGLELGLRIVEPPKGKMFKTTDDVCLGFALAASSQVERASLILKEPEFNPSQFTFDKLSNQQRADFIEDSMAFRSIKSVLGQISREFWSNYENGKGHIRQLELKVQRGRTFVSSFAYMNVAEQFIPRGCVFPIRPLRW